eukprot:1116699-Rhodomonas_salina.4
MGVCVVATAGREETSTADEISACLRALRLALCALRRFVVLTARAVVMAGRLVRVVLAVYMCYAVRPYAVEFNEYCRRYAALVTLAGEADVSGRAQAGAGHEQPLHRLQGAGTSLPATCLRAA